MSDVPFYERITCTVPQALQATGLGRTKFYELVNRGVVEITKIDGRTLAIVASLKRLAQPIDPAAQKKVAA